jgi:hypothetical protein
MEAKETILKIRKLLFGEDTQVVREKFLDATLEDGTLVQIEPELVEGAAVIVIDAEGNPIAAPDGEHKLISGEVITTVEGAITKIEIPVEEDEVKEDVVVEELEKDLTEKQEQKVKKVVESIVKESHFASVKDVNELKALVEETKKELKEMVFKAFEEFSNQTPEPTKKPAPVKKKRNIFINN